MSSNVVSFLPIRLKQACYFILSKCYQFDHWHYRIVRENCRYFDAVSKLHRRLVVNTTIEIGCGIGEVISGLESVNKIGIDRDPAVIRAAKLLRSPAVRFFTDKEITPIVRFLNGCGSVCLIFLNWFHVYDEEDVSKIVRNYIELFSPTYIIFDVINQSAIGYRYKHAPQMLNRFSTIIDIVDAGDDIRQLVIVGVCR